jgi:uncharacterized membrane protein
MDIFFGTFKASFKDHPVDKDGPKPRDDAKSSLCILPTKEFVTYLGLSYGCVLSWAYAALYGIHVSEMETIGLSSLVGFGPVVLAWLVSRIFGSAIVHPVSMSTIGNILHLSVGTIFCSVPITYMCWLTIRPL